MIYIALLRGINVGGKATVSMAELKICFEAAGHRNVKTYINSGNVIFEAAKAKPTDLAGRLEAAIESHFKLPVKVLIKTPEELRTIASLVPATLKHDATNRCNVLFLWPHIDKPDILEQIPINHDVETHKYTPGAIIQQMLAKDATKSRLTRIVGTEIYKSITIRNINTVRKLITLTEAH